MRGKTRLGTVLISGVLSLTITTAVLAATPCEHRQLWDREFAYIDKISTTCRILTTGALIGVGLYVPYPSLVAELRGQRRDRREIRGCLWRGPGAHRLRQASHLPPRAGRPRAARAKSLRRAEASAAIWVMPARRPDLQGPRQSRDHQAVRIAGAVPASLTGRKPSGRFPGPTACRAKTAAGRIR